jgi:hypothetical protein
MSCILILKLLENFCPEICRTTYGTTYKYSVDPPDQNRLHYSPIGERLRHRSILGSLFSATSPKGSNCVWDDSGKIGYLRRSQGKIRWVEHAPQTPQPASQTEASILSCNAELWGKTPRYLNRGCLLANTTAEVREDRICSPRSYRRRRSFHDQ